MDEAAEIARVVAESLVVGLPDGAGVDLGPVVSAVQFDKIQGLIAAGIAEGARLVTGGLGRPDGLDGGYFVRPTVFADVRPEMVLARTEIFGPVLSLMGFVDEDEAVSIANGTEYGLAAYVQSADLARARRVARRMRAGWVEINYAPFDYLAPFGGYRQSGNGREYGVFGLLEYLEVKAVMGG
jgi:aldehyde dehydrogenase (NAD+)